ERVVVGTQWRERGVANRGGGGDGGTVFFQSESPAGENFLIASGMQVSEAARELDLFTVNRDRAIGALAELTLRSGYILCFHRKEPAHPRTLVLEVPGGTGVT